MQLVYNAFKNIYNPVNYLLYNHISAHFNNLFMCLLNPVFSCSKSLLSFSADKVTIETYNLQTFIANAAFVGALIAITGRLPVSSADVAIISVKTQFLDQVKIIFTSQLTNGILELFQNLPRCFSGTTISAFFITLLSSLSLSGVFPIILPLYLNDAEFVIGSPL